VYYLRYAWSIEAVSTEPLGALLRIDLLNVILEKKRVVSPAYAMDGQSKPCQPSRCAVNMAFLPIDLLNTILEKNLPALCHTSSRHQPQHMCVQTCPYTVLCESGGSSVRSRRVMYKELPMNSATGCLSCLPCLSSNDGPAT
jgi:hypothetical protein